MSSAVIAAPPPRLRPAALFVLLAVLTAIVLLILGRGMTFFHDEWAYIDGRAAWELQNLFAPYNGHWSTVPILIYNVLLETVGLRAYLPYQFVVVLLHVATAGALFVLIRRESGALLAFAAGALFLLLGTGNESLFWGAQIGWNAAMAAGAWALVLTLDQPAVKHPWLAAVLLIVSVASSAVGLAYLAAVALGRVLTRERISQLWIVAPAAVAFTAWYLLAGRVGPGAAQIAQASLTDVPEFVVAGFGNAMGRVSGWGDVPGLVIAMLLTVATLWRLLGGRPILAGATVGLGGVLVFFALSGVTRAGIGTAESERYVYVAAFFLLLALASWLGTLDIRARRGSVAVLGALLVVALMANLAALWIARAAFLERAEHTRAAILVLTGAAGFTDVPLDRGLSPIPSGARLNDLLARYGSPLHDALAPVRVPSAEMLEMVRQEILVAP